MGLTKQALLFLEKRSLVRQRRARDQCLVSKICLRFALRILEGSFGLCPQDDPNALKNVWVSYPQGKIFSVAKCVILKLRI